MARVLHLCFRRQPTRAGLSVAYTTSVVTTLSAGASDRPLATIRHPARPHPDVLVAARGRERPVASRAGSGMEALRPERLGAVLLRPPRVDRPPYRGTDLDDARH